MNKPVRVVLLDEAKKEYARLNKIVGLQISQGKENSEEIINIKEFTKGSEKKFKRIKSRLIGTQGKTRKVIERLTNCNLVIYGKTVSLIGGVETIIIARKGVEKLLSGSPHGNVYGFIEREIRKLKIK